jgi:hypothetical protein
MGKQTFLIGVGALLGLSLGMANIAEAAFKKINPSACLAWTGSEPPPSGLGYDRDNGMYEGGILGGGGDLYCFVPQDDFLASYEVTSAVVHVFDGDPGNFTSERFNIKACAVQDRQLVASCGNASSNSVDSLTSITVSDLSTWTAGDVHSYLFIGTMRTKTYAVATLIAGATLGSPEAASAFTARLVSAMTCQIDDTNNDIIINPPYVHINNLTSGGAVICALPDSTDQPTTTISAVNVKVSDQEFGTQFSDHDVSTKLCYRRGLLSGGCGTASSSSGTGNFTLTPGVSQMANTTQSLDVSYLYVDFPDWITSTQISHFNGYTVLYP